ncbi:DYH10 protein, partial [Urocolius indicus]|nr:DYH10 protein [Urocolius indicus]
TKLEMPSIDLDGEVTALATVPEVVDALESCAMTWQKLISTAVEEQLKKVPQGNGPLAEIDFWRERGDALSALTEQIKLPEVQKVIGILQEAKSKHLGDLQIVLSDLRKHHVEALDNTKFLAVLEHPLKNLTYGTGFSAVLNAIPPLMDALRLVWMMSRHYNKDERMVPFMERIAWELSTRVQRAVDLHVLFKQDRAAAKRKIAEAKSTLEQWKKRYFDVRAEIQALGRAKHWEFDRKALFEKTDYMSSVCQDLYDILQVVTEELRSMFCRELIAVAGDLKHIHNLLTRVKGLTSPMEELTFDPFSMKSERDWKLMMEEFREEVLVENIQQVFVQNLKDPPLCKGHPPVAGAIYWSRLLFDKIECPITRFQEVEELLAGERGEEIKQIYLQVAKRLKEYEDQKYNQWRDETEQNLLRLLENTLMTSSVTEESAITKKSVHFTVNFPPSLHEVILETKHMDVLGFEVPEMARYVALREDEFLGYRDRLKKVLDLYDKLMGTLDEAETKLLDDHIQDLWTTFKWGHTMINWISLGVGDFLAYCTESVEKFELLICRIHTHSGDINNKLLFIESTNLFKFPLPKNGDELPGAEEFFEYVKCERAKDVARMVRKYSAIPQFLIKVERCVAKTKSGKSPKLASYYAYWENRIYQVLTQLIVKNLQAFHAAVLANVPLFQTEAILSVPEIILQANASEIENMTAQCIQDCVEVTKHFVRWMHGTCIECPPQDVNEGETFVFSFYSDICQNPLIKNQAILIPQNVQRVLASLSKYLNQWKRYHVLWELDKDVAMEKLAAEKPTCVTFDEELRFYMNVAQEVTQQPLIKDGQFVRLQLTPLAHTVQDYARGWMISLGKLLHESAREELFSLQEEIQVGVFSL